MFVLLLNERYYAYGRFVLQTNQHSQPSTGYNVHIINGIAKQQSNVFLFKTVEFLIFDALCGDLCLAGNVVFSDGGGGGELERGFVVLGLEFTGLDFGFTGAQL